MGFFDKKPKSGRKKQQARQIKNTRGTIASCACPWCKKPNNFRDVEDYALEAGNILECDYCHKNFKIQRVRMVTEIVLSPTRERGNLRGG